MLHQKASHPLHKVCDTYPTVIRLGTVMYQIMNIPKKYTNQVIKWGNSWVLLKLAFFHISEHKEANFIYIHYLWFFYFCWVFEGCFNELDCIFDDGTNIGHSRPPQNNSIFENGNGVMVSVCRVTKKILSRKWNNSLGMVMPLKVDKSSISVKEVIITSIFKRFD